MITAWFLIVTMCGVDTNKPGSECDDYIVDGGLNYMDCRNSLARVPEKDGVYSIRCEKGEIAKNDIQLPEVK